MTGNHSTERISTNIRDSSFSPKIIKNRYCDNIIKSPLIVASKISKEKTSPMIKSKIIINAPQWKSSLRKSSVQNMEDQTKNKLEHNQYKHVAYALDSIKPITLSLKSNFSSKET